MQKLAHQTLVFDEFVLDLTRGCLLRDGQEVKLRPKSFETLKHLVENNGRLVSKNELMTAVWPDSFVTDDSLVQCLRDVRLGLNDNGQRYIKTVPRRGYIFDADVKELNLPAKEAVFTEQVEGVRMVIEEGQPATEGKTRRIAKPAVGRRWSSNPIVLAGFLAFVGVVALLIYFGVMGSSSIEQPKAAPAVRVIAVLPFKPLSNNASDEYLGLGMADTLITKLSNIREIVVRPTSAVRKYTAAGQDPIAAGREQGVDAVLEGSIQMSGEKIRVTVRLINVRDGSPLWGFKCDEYCTDILAVQDAMSEKVAEALALELTGDEKKLLAKRYTQNTEAYQLYLKGRYFWNKYTKDGFDKGIVHVKRAIEIDPNYALAYAGLADSYYRASNLYLPVREAFPKAKQAALKALELDDSLAEAHSALGVIKYRYDWDWPGAESEFKRAIAVNPGYATAHEEYGWYLMALGRFDEAQAEMERAKRLDPLSLITDLKLGTVFFFRRQYDRAIEHYHKTIQLDSNFMFAHLFLGWAHERRGEFPEAVSEFQKAMTLDYVPILSGHLAYTYAVSGQSDEARKLLNKLLKLPKGQYIAPYDVATVYAGLGEKDQAFEWLEKAYNEPSEILIWLKIDPRFDNLRSDPRLQDLLRRIRLT